jgi:hypothetical protein
MVRGAANLIAISLCAGLFPNLALAQSVNNGPRPLNAGVGSLALNAGRILCTAAINSNGTIATTLTGSFINAAQTLRLSQGAYQVAFLGPCSNVQAANGWFRLVQVDTLTTGFLGGITCSVADRAGLPNAIFVGCTNNTGVFTDASFTLSVSR